MKTESRIKSKGMTLIELSIAVLLTAVVALGAARFANLLFRTGADVESNFANVSQANLAMTTVYERIWSAQALPPNQFIQGQTTGSNQYFAVNPNCNYQTFANTDCSGVSFMSTNAAAPIESVAQTGDQVVYTTADGTQHVLATGVQTASFYSIPCAGVTNCMLGIQFNLAGTKGGLAFLPRTSSALPLVGMLNLVAGGNVATAENNPKPMGGGDGPSLSTAVFPRFQTTASFLN